MKREYDELTAALARLREVIAPHTDINTQNEMAGEPIAVIEAAIQFVTNSEQKPKRRYFDYDALIEKQGDAIRAMYLSGRSWAYIARQYSNKIVTCDRKQLARRMQEAYPDLETRTREEQVSLSKRKRDTPAVERLTKDDVRSGWNDPYLDGGR